MEEIINSSLDTLLQNEIDKQSVTLHFQTIKGINGRRDMYECLARLENNIDISPLIFLKAIKRNGLYPKFTRKVIDLSFSTFNKNKLPFSINFDFEDIMNEEVVTHLIDEIQKKDISSQLTIEILENKIDSFDQVFEFRNLMKRLGVKIAIDDFGSNYCNFINIINISPDIIKIDGSIIKVLEKDKNAQIVVKSITSMAKDMNIEVVAEYIENKKIFQIARSQGVQYFQGFYISKPSPNIQIKL